MPRISIYVPAGHPSLNKVNRKQCNYSELFQVAFRRWQQDEAAEIENSRLRIENDMLRKTINKVIDAIEDFT